MKWIFETIKYLAGYIYIAWKLLAFFFIATFLFLWEFKFEVYKKVWDYVFDAFYTERSRGGEHVLWKYRTIDDFVQGAKSL